MSSMNAQTKRKSCFVRAKVTRADGTVEHHGLVSFYHRNPLINFAGQIVVLVNAAYRWVAFPRNRELGRQIKQQRKAAA